MYKLINVICVSRCGIRKFERSPENISGQVVNVAASNKLIGHEIVIDMLIGNYCFCFNN